jgi:putative ATPase
MDIPLAERLRPNNLSEYIGQEHLVGVGKPIRVAMEQKHRMSFILWGPPGVGKTTLARIYANSLGAEFVVLSAVSAGKDDVRKVVATAEDSKLPVVLFLDEIHRFNKAQQDFLLPYVEKGVIWLIGATTENPSFEVIAPLLSRCRVFVLNEIGEKDMEKIIDRVGMDVPKEAKDWLVRMANGDARQVVTMLENTHKLYGKVDVKSLTNTLQSSYLRYDKQGEEHYNTISAFIKSMRASNVDAAMYYLARLVEAGEDPLFIARRMVIFASEDVGMGQPTALVVANEVFRACETIGYPECAINLAHGVVYLSTAKKDRRAYDALRSAQEDVKQFGNLPIPMQIRNAPTNLMKKLGYGKGYEMYTNKSLLPDKLKDKTYFK